ncbi:MAG: helix-turn-helix domain-containing protein [Sphingorhabdus sp.]
MTDAKDIIQQRALADAMAARSGKPGAPRPTAPASIPGNNALTGEGVSDPAELLRLIGLIRQAESESQQAQRMIVIGEFSVMATRVPETFVGQLPGLTRMEAAVMRMLGWGRANHDIAMLLDSTENTVRTHMNNVIRKLELDGMRDLIALAGLLFHPLD